MALPDKINEIRAKVLSEALGKGLPESQKLTIFFQAASSDVKRPQITTDGLGKEQARGPIVAADVSGLSVNTYTYQQGKIHGSHGTLVNRERYGYASQGGNPLAGLLNASSEQRGKINFTWDKYTTRLINQRGTVGWQDPAPYINVRKIAKTAFEDINEYGPVGQNIGSFVRSVSKKLAAATPAPGSSLHYLNESLSAFGTPFEQLNPAQQLEGVFNAAVLKASATGKMQGIKNILSSSGIEGISGAFRAINSTRDPFGLAGVLASGTTYRGAAGEDLTGFLNRVRHFAGDQYTDKILAPWMNRMYDETGKGLRGKLGFALTEHGGLFIGQGSLAHTYQPIPLEVIGNLGHRSAAGLSQGMLMLGNELTGTRQARLGNEYVPASQVMLEEFIAGARDPHAGLGQNTIEIALKTAHGRARAATKNLRHSIYSRGEINLASLPAIGQSAYDSFTHAGMDEANKMASGIIGKLASVREAFDAIKEAGKFNLLQGQTRAFYAVAPKTGQVALQALEQFLVRGSVTDKEALKGIFHRLRPLEISEQRASIIAARVGRLKGKYGRAPLQAATIGMTEGQFSALEAVQAAYRGAPGALLGLKGTPTTSFAMPVLFRKAPPSIENALSAREIFGEPGYISTGMGRKMFSGMMRPTHTAKLSANESTFKSILNVLAGEGGYESNKLTSHIFDTIKSGKRWTSGNLRITDDVRKQLQELGVKVPLGASRLTGMHSQGWDEMLHMTFATKVSPRSMELMVGGGRSILNRSSTYHFSHIKKAAAVTSMETFSNLNQAYIRFYDATQMAGYAKGGVEAFATKYNQLASGNAKAAQLEVVRSANSVHLVPRGNVESYEHMIEPMQQALRQLGISRHVVFGHAKSRARFFGARGAELAHYDDNALLLFTEGMMRPKATEDISSQAKAMRLRLRHIETFASGHQEMYGVAAKDSPIFMRQVQHWEKSTGLRINPMLLSHGSVPSGKQLIRNGSAADKHMIGMLSQFSTDKVMAASQKYNIPIISEEEAIREFITGPRGMTHDFELHSSGIPAERFHGSSLFNDGIRPKAYREGVFVKTTRPRSVPLTNKAGEVQTVASGVEHMFIPGTAVRKFWGYRNPDRGLGVRLASDSLEYNILGYLTHQAYRDPDSSKAEIFLQNMYKGIANYSGNNGAIKEALTSSRMSGGAAMRLAPNVELDFQSLANLAVATKPTEEMFTARITKADMRRMFKTSEEYEKALGEMQGRGFLWGQTHPYPFHQTSHSSLVKFKLVNEAKSIAGHTAANEPTAMLGAFLTWKMNRDNDKDVVYSLISSHYTDDERKMLDKMFKYQIEQSSSGLYDTFRAEVAKAAQSSHASVKSWLKGEWLKEKSKNLSELVEHYGAFLRFGRTPTLAYAGHWDWTAFTGALASGYTDTEVAHFLNSNVRPGSLRGAFTGEQIADIRKSMTAGGHSIETIRGVSSLVEGNMLQSFITKGGAYQEASVEMLEIRNVISKGVDAGRMTRGEAVQHAIERSRTYFGGLAKDGKFKYPGGHFNGMTEAQAVEAAAQIYGTAIGTSVHTYASMVAPEHRVANWGDTLRATTKTWAEQGNTQAAARFYSIEIEGSKGLIASGQENLAEANLAQIAKAAGELPSGSVMDKAQTWFKHNWKVVGAIAGGIYGLRLASRMMSDDDLNRPPLRSSQRLQFAAAPQGPEPMVSPPPQDINVSRSIGRQRVMVQPPGGMYTKTQFNGSYDTVNTNTMAFGSESFGGVDIRDSRSYATNWQLQTMADANDNSDFIHPYMPMI